MIIGDVLGIIAGIVGIVAAWVATLLVAALAFPERAALAQQRIEKSPGVCLGRGLVLFLLVGLVAGILAKGPGPIRLLSGAMLTCLAAIAAVGSAGIVRLLGERIQSTGTQMSPFAALTRGSILYVIAGLVPILGWFLVIPAATWISIGGAVGRLWPFSPSPKIPSPAMLSPVNLPAPMTPPPVMAPPVLSPTGSSTNGVDNSSLHGNTI